MRNHLDVCAKNAFELPVIGDSNFGGYVGNGFGEMIGGLPNVLSCDGIP